MPLLVPALILSLALHILLGGLLRPLRPLPGLPGQVVERLHAELCTAEREVPRQLPAAETVPAREWPKLLAEKRTAAKTAAELPVLVAEAPAADVPAAHGTEGTEMPTARNVPVVETAPDSADAPAWFRPGYRDNPLPDYPSQARRLGQQGEVRLRVHVGADGQPLHVELVRGSGHALLDRAGLQAVRAWRFRPARSGGTAVASWVEVPLRFLMEMEN